MDKPNREFYPTDRKFQFVSEKKMQNLNSIEYFGNSKMHVRILIGMIILIFIIAGITFIYHRTAANQQTISLTIPFDTTYRYVPMLEPEKKFKVDTIKVTITTPGSSVTPAASIRRMVEDAIIQPYRNCLILQDTHMFTVPEAITHLPSDSDPIILKRCPMAINPTVENLSIILFRQLAPVMSKIGGHLISIKLQSGEITARNSRYKISDYTT